MISLCFENRNRTDIDRMLGSSYVDVTHIAILAFFNNTHVRICPYKLCCTYIFGHKWTALPIEIPSWGFLLPKILAGKRSGSNRYFIEMIIGALQASNWLGTAQLAWKLWTAFYKENKKTTIIYHIMQVIKNFTFTRRSSPEILPTS